MDYTKEIEALEAKRSKLEEQLETKGISEQERLAIRQRIIAIGQEITAIRQQLTSLNNKEAEELKASLFYKVKLWSGGIWFLWSVHPRYVLWRHHYVRNYSTAWTDRFSSMYPSAEDWFLEKTLSMNELFKNKPSCSQVLCLKYMRSMQSVIFISFFVCVTLCPYSVYRTATEVVSVYRAATEVVQTYLWSFTQHRYTTDIDAITQLGLAEPRVIVCPKCKTKACPEMLGSGSN